MIGAAQKVEHYEISGYGTARTIAQALGNKEVASLLQETLKEEEQTDKNLTKIALKLYKETHRSAGQNLEEEEEPSGRGMSRGRGAASRSQSSSRGMRGSNGHSRSSSKAGSKSRSQSAGRSGAGAVTTTDPDEIRQWAEDRGAKPACVKGTGNKKDAGVLRFDFPGYSGAESLQPIDWDEFFEKFEENGLALLYQPETARGQKSNFNKLVSRESAKAAGGRRASR
jgi:hypothetical protein